MSKYEQILYAVKDRVATITLNRPERMNAWTPVMEKEVRDAIHEFFKHLRDSGVFPRKLVLDRKVEDRHGQVSYFCMNDTSDEVEVITDSRLEPGQIYLCLSASNPKYVNPILVPELAAP